MKNLPLRYRPLRPLGQGGMGQVWLALDEELGREVAIKILGLAARASPQARARFAREAAIQASVTHPHLVMLLDFDAAGPEPYLVMERIDGETLERRLQDLRTLEPAAVHRLATEVGGALAALHGADIVHRDLKPTNIMLRRRDGGAVLMDLGLAAREDGPRLTATGTIVGTPAYLPPEVVQGGDWGPASDQYQLGAVLFEALVGHELVPSADLCELHQAIGSGGFGPIPGGGRIPQGMRTAIERSIRLNPEDRFPSVGDLVGALDPGGSDEESSRPAAATVELAPPADPKLFETMRRREAGSPASAPGRAWIRAGAAALVLLAAATVWRGWLAPEPIALRPGAFHRVLPTPTWSEFRSRYEQVEADELAARAAPTSPASPAACPFTSPWLVFWRTHARWVAQLLAEPIGATKAAWLFETWQRWDRYRTQQICRDLRIVGPSGKGPGLRWNGPPEETKRVRRGLPLGLQEAGPEAGRPPRGYVLVPDDALSDLVRKGWEHRSLRLVWPADAPVEPRDLVLSVRAAGLEESLSIVVKPASWVPGDWSAKLWGTRSRPSTGNHSLQGGWLNVGIPTALAWKPGTELSISTEHLWAAAIQRATVVEVVASWAE